MQNPGRKFLAGVAALAAALLGLETIAGVSVTPGERTGFHWTVDPSDSAVIHLRSDVGNLSTWIDLIVQASPGQAIEWTAHLPGRPLHVRTVPNGPNSWRLEISRTDSSAQEQFTWRSGQAIALSSAGAREQRVTDWTLHTDKGRDTEHFALWRTIWFYVLVACTVVGIGWGVTSAVSQQEAPPALLVEELAIATVKQVIATSEGSDAEETQRIRKVLRAIALDQTPPGYAVENVLPRDATLGQKYGLQRRSSVLFTRRMDALIRLLFRFRQSVRLR